MGCFNESFWKGTGDFQIPLLKPPHPKKGGGGGGEITPSGVTHISCIQQVFIRELSHHALGVQAGDVCGGEGPDPPQLWVTAGEKVPGRGQDQAVPAPGFAI